MKSFSLRNIGRRRKLVKFAAVAVTLLVGGIAYSNRPNTPATPSLTSPIDIGYIPVAEESKVSADNELAKPASGPFLVIKEWGVKINMQEAEKITYDFKNYSYALYGQEVSVATLRVKPEFLKDKSCNLSADWTRYQRQDDRLKEITVKIGDYYFVNGSNPYNCQNPEDNKLFEKVLTEFTNIQVL